MFFEATDIKSQIFAWCGFITAICFYLAPGAIIYNLVKNNANINNVSGLSIIACYFNCLLWVSASINGQKSFETNDDLKYLIICNYTGWLLCLIWTIVYLYYFTEKKIFKFSVYLFTIIDLSAESFLFMRSQKINDSVPEYINYIAAVFNIVMYFNPGLNIIHIIKTSNNKMIYLPGAILGAVNSLLWLLFGIFEKKWHVIIANAAGLIICLFLIALYYIFYKKRKMSMDTEKTDISLGPEAKSSHMKLPGHDAFENLGLL